MHNMYVRVPCEAETHTHDTHNRLNRIMEDVLDESMVSSHDEEEEEEGEDDDDDDGGIT